jgi:hypothetical protein
VSDDKQNAVPSPRYGEVVRTDVGATGVYIGYDLVLYVCAQDNDLALAGVDPRRQPPWEGAPLPTDREMQAAKTAYRAGLNDATFGTRP